VKELTLEKFVVQKKHVVVREWFVMAKDGDSAVEVSCRITPRAEHREPAHEIKVAIQTNDDD
jgi:hypothetical protein